MITNVSKTLLAALNDKERTVLKTLWTPQDGDILLQDEKEYILVGNVAYPRNGGHSVPFSKFAFLPLLSAEELVRITTDVFHERFLNYEYSDVGTPYLFDERFILTVWHDFVLKFRSYIDYQELVDELTVMMLNTFELEDTRTEEDDYVVGKLQENYKERFTELVEKIQQNYFSDEESLWENAWHGFNEKGVHQ